MVNRATPSGMTEQQQQYQAMEQTLVRAGYTHEAYVEERPKLGHGSLVFSTLHSPTEQSYGAAGLEQVFNPRGSTQGIGLGGIATGASSMYGGGASTQMQSPVSAGGYAQKRYAHTVRSSASSILSLGRQKTEPPVMILPHYNSPYESIFFNQPDVMHFVGKDLRIGTICISLKPTQNVMHFIVRTVLKFINLDIPESYRSSPEFEQCRSLYPKKNDLLPLLHTAIHHCLESIPESEVQQHQVVQHLSAKDHSVFVLDEPGWMQSAGYISSIVRGLEEIRQEGFTHVLKNLEAQMRPAALTIDFVVPDQESLSSPEKERFWEFFNGLGDRVEPGTYLPHAPKASLCMPDMTVGIKNEEQRSEALTELIETESKYNTRMQDLVNVYLAEARIAAAGPNAPLGKYEIRVIFSNIEQILAVSTDFLNDLREYQNDNAFGQSLGEICQKNLKRMGCYKQYLVRYKRAQETLSALSRKLPAFKAFQERCAHNNGIQILPNLLVEPTQRIVKYPLLFKGILSGTSEDSADVDGIRQAAEMASQIAHMTKAKPEQNAEVLFNIRNIIEHCPDTLLSQSRSAVTYLDGHETNMLTGERGKPITLILFSDKVMIARRPKGVSGEVLFQLKEDEDERKRAERREKDRRDRERKAKKDGRGDKMDDKDENENAPGAHGSAYTTAGFALLRKDWKFMGWMDLLKISIAIVEQTDPEGLFCMTTQNHTETKDDLWETTRGIMPEHLEKRDSFVSKFYETLTLAKATGVSIMDTSSCPSDYTSRLHVAELELFCNVYTASQYRDVLYKGDVALLYTSGGAAGQALMDMRPFSRLPLFAGMIQATESGLRVVLKGKASLNDSANASLSSEQENRFLDIDAFQIHITELVANLQWTTYHFDPYQNAQLHFSRTYLRTDYLYKTASSFSRATTLRTRSLKKILDSTSATQQQNFSSGYSNRHYNGASSPSVGSPYGNATSPNSPGGGLVRHYQLGNFSNIGSRFGSTAPMSPRTPPRSFTVPDIKQQRQRDRPSSHLRGDGADSARENIGIRLQQPPLPPNHQLQLGAGNVLRESVATMGALIPPDSDLLKLELQNYKSAIAYEVLRTYLEEMYAYSPLVARADVQEKFGACLRHKKVGEMSELILLRCQTYLDEMRPESQYILGAIISCYIRLRNSKQYRGHLDTLSLKMVALVMANSSEPDGDASAGSLTAKKNQILLLDIWAQFYPALWTDVSKSVTDSQHESDTASCTSSRKSPQALPLSTFSPTDADTDTVLSFASQSTATRHTPSVEQTTYAGQFCPQGMDVAGVTTSTREFSNSTARQVHFVDHGDESTRINHRRQSSDSEDGSNSALSVPADTITPLESRALSSPHADGLEHDLACSLTRGRDDIESIRAQIQQIRDNFSQEIHWLGAQVAQQGTLSRESSTSSSCTAISVSLQESETKLLSTITEDADLKSFNDGEDIDGLDELDPAKPRNPQGLSTANAEKECIENGIYGADPSFKKGYQFPIPLMVEEYCEDDCGVKLESESEVEHVDDYPSVMDAVNISAALSEADLDVDSNRHSREALGVKERLAHLSTDPAQVPFSGRRSRHMADYVRHLRGQITAITESNLDMLDRCLASAQESQSEIGVHWEMMASQQEHLKEQLNDAMEYQIRLEYENEAIRDLYDEVTEENNIIFERFNEELEHIFEAVNTPSGDTVATDASKNLRHDRRDHGSSEGSCFSTDNMTHENDLCEDSDPPSDSQLRRLLQKAIQDRSLAEQQARRAILQASYFRDLLERHGVEIETTDLFE
ncbi:hypothetical protein BGZ70_010117 [Mortierella alpina]|uniref:DH domain-containing protein n=1 Tax=Mortierella alpina TaxID=64518 RepID=A0A9P6LZM0_MORAP|nr:hypothetical protein BGZ70_010117 [Mortierella alpina]